MNEKIDAVLNKVTDLFEGWVDEFQNHPVRTTVKVILILYALKVAKRLVREIAK